MITSAREKLEAARATLDALDATLALEGLRPNDLDEVRQRLDPAPPRPCGGERPDCAPRH